MTRTKKKLSFEEWENQRGLKTVDKEKVSAAILAEYDNREQF